MVAGVAVEEVDVAVVEAVAVVEGEMALSEEVVSEEVVVSEEAVVYSGVCQIGDGGLGDGVL